MQSKKKKVDWIKMPVNLTDDERIGKLMSKLGMKGFGVYVCLINEMYKKQCQHLTLTQIKNMKFPGVTNKTIMEVVNNYGLFTEKYDKVIYSAIDFISKGSYIQIQSDCNRIAIGFKSDSFSTHTRDDKDIDIKIKDNHIDAVDDDNSTEMASLEPPSEDRRKEDNSSDVADMEASEKEGACILDIPINSAWSEILMMKSGFSTLLMRNWQFALEVFRQHVIVNCKLNEVRNVEDAKRYFHFYVTNPVSGLMLRKKLEEHEAENHCNGLFRFEDACSRPGFRFYKGIPIPSMAPPRPDNSSEWDPELNAWVK